MLRYALIKVDHMAARNDFANTIRIDMMLKDRSAARKGSGRTALRRKDSSQPGSSLHSDFQKLFHTAYDAGLISTMTGSVVEANQRASEFFQYSEDCLRGLSISDLIEGVGEELLRKLRDSLSTNRYALIRAHCARKDGSLFPAEIAVSQLVLDEVFFSFFVRDITKRLQLETQLAHSRKMESVGQLASGIAHEINTPTQFIGNNLTFLGDAFRDMETVLNTYGQLLEKLKAGTATEGDIADLEKQLKDAEIGYLMDEIPKTISQSLDGVSRVASIVQAMRTLSYRSTGEPTETNINKLLEDTVTVSRNEWKYVADVELDLDPELHPVACLPDELAQVFLNLIVNAAQAIKQTLSPESSEKGAITVKSAMIEDRVEIRISDTGSGIRPEIKDRIFEPFFTTKEVGSGSGQGLAIAYNVVVGKHGGEILFESAPGQGTTFIVRLPTRMPVAGS